MDTSKEYIKMCEKVDLDFEFNIGDFVFLDNKVQPIIYADHQHYMVDNSWESYIKVPSSLKLFNSEEAIPMYRQDQLQNMIGDFKFIWSKTNQFISESAEYKIKHGIMKDYSMEQLWLAFVMKEKYNKTWNRKEWVK